MIFLQTRSIMAMSDKEVKIRLLYAYQIFASMNESQIDSDIVRLVISFVNRLNKLIRFTFVLDKFVMKLWAENYLHFVPEEEDEKVWTFSFTKKRNYHFYEDADADTRFSFLHINEEITANFIRCLYVDPKKFILRIIEHTFFTESLNVDMRKIPVPKSLRRAADKLELTAFLSESGATSENQAFVIQALFRYCTTTEFEKNISSCSVDSFDFLAAIGITDEQIEEVKENLQVGVLNGFLDEDMDITRNAVNCIMAKTLQPYFSSFSRKMALEDAYPIESFSVKKDELIIAKSLLENSSAANILLYGASGSGKTEFAKSLTKSCHLKAVRFKNSYETEQSVDAAVCALNLLLSIERKDTVFIIDEAESILETKPIDSIFGSVARKGSVNKLFEHCRNKVIWIVNYTEHMDDSTKRRFTYSIPFARMSEEKFMEITKSNLKKIQCSPKLKSRIIDLCSKYEVTGASLENMMSVMKAFKSSDEECIENTVRNVLESNSSLLYGQAKMREKTKAEYDESVLNTSVPASQIVQMVENAKEYAEKNHVADSGVRMLFYGLSGTGKTEFARHIAQKLGKHILLKRASDIISCYVGDTEKKISEAFAEAERGGQILLFDEADSFFRERESAKNSWEITQTNEFLTQMEEFNGILICTTNLRNIMDKAMLRRFHICTEFKALDGRGIEKLLGKYFSSIKFTDRQVKKLSAYNSVTPGDFGALSGRVRFMPQNLITSDYVTDELIALQKEKNGAGSGKTIGFCA